MYIVFIEEKVDVIFVDLKLVDVFFGIEIGIEYFILDNDENGRVYFRGVFLLMGIVREFDFGKY